MASRGASRGLASVCAVCRGWGRQRVCHECVGRFAIPVPRCGRCAIETGRPIPECGHCLADPPPWRHAIAAVNYAYPWDRLVAGFKFHAALELAAAFVERMLEARKAAEAHVESAAVECAAASDDPPLLLPVPLSAERLRERGYNQAWELARRLGRAQRVPAEAALLLRLRDTPHQLALPPDQRIENVRGAFAIEPRRIAEVRGRRVTLVDDVMTSGATAAECARVLLHAGAAQVDVWVLARTPRPHGAD